MARSPHYSEVEVKAGLFLAFCLALFVGMLILYGRVSRFWRERQEVNVVFASVSALRPEAAVRYNGVEIGRVKTMRIVHLDPSVLARIRPFHRSNLDDLPLTENQRRELRLVPDYDFDKAVKEALLEKTMIQLSLEVLVEGHHRRYREDDSVRIASTILGDASIEIVSGNGRPLESEEDTILFGSSGDFFQSLARSVDQVEDVLSSVTDVVGAQERLAFKRASVRVDAIMTRFGEMTAISEKRASITSEKFNKLDDASSGAMDSAGKLFERLQPDSARLFDTLSSARRDVSDRLQKLQDTGKQARAETMGVFNRIQDDVRFMLTSSSPHLEEMKANLQRLAMTLGGVTDRVSNMEHMASRSLEQSMPDLERGVEGIKISAENLKTLRYIREITDKLISSKELGEHNFYTMLDTYDRLQRISRPPRDALADVESLRSFVRGYPEPNPPLTEADLDRVNAKIRKFAQELDDARTEAGGTFLPPFTGNANASGKPFVRKRAGRVEIPVK